MVLPNSLRLRGHKCFDYLYKQGRRLYGKTMIIRVVKPQPKLLKAKNSPKNQSFIKCAVSISNKVSKKAVERNKIRRMLHEHLREKLKESEIESWALITLKPESANSTPQSLIKECDSLLYKAGLL